MNSQRLLTILLVGMLLSACAHIDPHRTDSSQGFECAVDDKTVTNDRKLCEDGISKDSHAIQHRFYTASFKYKDKGTVKQDEPEKRDYYLSFVEFDDQGWFADRKQMEALFARLKDLKDKKRKTLIYVYAHGWKHNASACDNNVVCFSRLLERLDLAEKKIWSDDPKTQRTVVGVYLGWRGLPFGSFLNNVSFWTRKEAAARVGRGGVFELLTRLNDYRESRQEEETDRYKTQLVITGHSFGGLVIYSALSHALMEKAAKTTNVNGATQYDVAKSFGDFVMLVNPAFEGSLYEPLFHIATNRCYDERPPLKDHPGRKKQQPVMMIVTSEADSATGKAFPIARTLGTLFQHAKSSDQKQSMRKAIGHDERYRTHDLAWEGPDERPEKKKRKKCSCPHLDATLDWDQQSLLKLFEARLKGAFGSVEHKYGKGVSLAPVPLTTVPSPKYASNYPYLVVKANAEMIADHNAIYNERFINFAQLFFSYHIADSKPWTDPKESVLNCLRPEKVPSPTKGGLPSEQSCSLVASSHQSPVNFNKNGSSCSASLQQN